MTFLELCQRVGEESGTVAAGQPTTVTGQTGRLKTIVQWTAEAYQRIQTMRSNWLWLETEFEEDTIAGTARYTPASWGFTRFAGWMVSGDETDPGFSIYASAIGVADEGPLSFLAWRNWYVTQTRGVRENAKPTYFTISPAKEFCLSPTPDQVYVVRGRYRKGPQVLAANGDIPEMPEHYHMGIVSYALTLLSESDEAFGQGQYWNGRWQGIRSDLERDQMPFLIDGSEALA